MYLHAFPQLSTAPRSPRARLQRPQATQAAAAAETAARRGGGHKRAAMADLGVRRSAAWVMQHAQHVSINTAAVAAAADKVVASIAHIQAAGFDTELHFFDGGPATLQYLLVVDALNYCFWPDGQLEYEHLAGGLKARLLADPHCLDAQRLAAIDGPGVRQLLGWSRDLPQQDERARLLNEVGAGLLQHFGGQAAQLVAAAEGSAVALAQLVASHFPGFRDGCIYKGRQVCFYKRAQIFVADVFGAFKGQGCGAFHDIDELTMFADYRVPVVLRLMGLLSYDAQLAQQVDGKQEVAAGSEAEVEIRAGSILAVELLKNAANTKLLQQQQLLSIQLDWWLWQEGERHRTQHPPHHRTWTVFY